MDTGLRRYDEVAMDFQRTSRRSVGNLPLTPMIDVMFILIIFFMLTTSFMRIESLELLLPTASGKAADRQEVTRLYISPGGGMKLGDRLVNADELSGTLENLFRSNTKARVMLLTADGVTMQQMVGAMDRVYMAGGRSLFVRRWDTANAPAAKPPSGT